MGKFDELVPMPGIDLLPILRPFNGEAITDKRKVREVKKQVLFKRLSKDFVGQCELRQLPKGTPFKVVRKDGSLSKETYIKDSYYPPNKTFISIKCSDVWGNGRAVKGVQLVSTNFDW